MSRVDTLPDDRQIPPADGLLFGQSHSQSVLEFNVGFVHLDNTHTHITSLQLSVTGVFQLFMTICFVSHPLVFLFYSLYIVSESLGSVNVEQCNTIFTLKHWLLEMLQDLTQIKT